MKFSIKTFFILCAVSRASSSTNSKGNGRRDSKIMLVTILVPVVVLEQIVLGKVVAQSSCVHRMDQFDLFCAILHYFIQAEK